MSEYFDEGDLEETLDEAEANMCVHMTCSEIDELIAQRDALKARERELVEALRDLHYCSQHARANGYESEFSLRTSEDRARAILAKVR